MKQFFQTITVADETREALDIRIWAFPERAHYELVPTNLATGTPLKITGLKLEPLQRPTVRLGKEASLTWFPNGTVPWSDLPILKARIVELNEWWAATKAPAVTQQPRLADLVALDNSQFEVSLRFLVCQWVGVELGPPTENDKRLVICDGSRRPGDAREFSCAIRIFPEYLHLFPEENMGRWMHIGPVSVGSTTPLSCAGQKSARKFSASVLKDDDPDVLDRLEMRRQLTAAQPPVQASVATPARAAGSEFSGPFVYAGSSSSSSSAVSAPAAPPLTHYPPVPFPQQQDAPPTSTSASTSANTAAPWRTMESRNSNLAPQQHGPTRTSSEPDLRSTKQLTTTHSVSDSHLNGQHQQQQQKPKKPTLLEEFQDPRARVVTRMLPKYDSLPLTGLNTVWSIVGKAQERVLTILQHVYSNAAEL
jgi:hypothetical protein